MRQKEGRIRATQEVPTHEAGAEETALIERVARGDPGAIEPLFHRYYDRLFRYLVRMLKDKGSAEELANEVFLDIWKGASRFEGRASVSSWIFSIAHNKAVSALRRRRETYIDEEKVALISDPSDPPSELAEKADVSRIVKKCLDELSPAHREVIELTYYQGMSIQEISQVAGIPENTVKTRMFYARRRLGELVRLAGIEGN